MRRLLLIQALGLAALALPAAAHAQSRDWLVDNPTSYSAERQSYYDSRGAAYDAGYREGLKEGEKDGRKGDRFAYQDEKAYQRADHGYHREYGDLERYRQSFRTGFGTGYSDGYQRYAPQYGYRNGFPPAGREPNWTRGPVTNGRPGYPGQSPGQYGTYTPAFQNGANDGYEKGVEDSRKGRSFDPLRHQWYRSADRHYDRRVGSKQQYEDTYRLGFRDGYERGYRSGRDRY